MCSDRLTIKSGGSSHKPRSTCLPAIFGCLPRILGCRLPICSEEIGDLPQVGSWCSHVRRSERLSEHQGSFALSCIHIHAASSDPCVCVNARGGLPQFCGLLSL